MKLDASILDARNGVSAAGDAESTIASATLGELENAAPFVDRHIGLAASDRQKMLAAIGVASMDRLIDAVIPATVRRRGALPLGEFTAARGEQDALAALRRLASKNQVFRNFIGQGYYGTQTPPVILRNVLENPAWYTAYTPYQPEISQGRLEALLNFQQMVCDLTGLDIANASLLDEATAAAEAMTLLQRAGKSPSKRFYVADDVLPQTIDVLRTRAEPLGLQIVVGPALEAFGPLADVAGATGANASDMAAQDIGDTEGASTANATSPAHANIDLPFGVLLQYPGVNGDVRDYRALTQRAHAAGAAVVVAADPLALTLLTPPGEWGADVAIGNTQRFGVPLGFGGPHAAYMAVRDHLKRQMPGRLVGVTEDSHHQPALRLALQTREQHIRREKATSNICTAQALLAIMASMYAVYHGPDGLRAIAARINRLTRILAVGLRQLGFTIANDSHFDTLTVCVGDRADALHAAAYARGVNLRVINTSDAGYVAAACSGAASSASAQASANGVGRLHAGGLVGVSLDETTRREDLHLLWEIFASIRPDATANRPGLDDIDAIDRELDDRGSLPAGVSRSSAFLTHPVFHRHRSETAMLRYLRALADKDLALDRTMIPLGSCTMKLNATAEMLPISWPEFANMHPFAPAEQTGGYREMIGQLERMLAACTGYAAVSLQPNAGSQGEYAGLLAIRGWHASRGQASRNVCLIPASAHGTNPASAQMAGMRVVLVACDNQGNVDIADLRAKAALHAGDLAAIMITYPSTHGVFETRVREICEIVHAHGGQVYIDGANMNAMVGLAAPGEFGGDVSHLNLHKTFCIPHGGGGPGVGPLAVREHLAPYLPRLPGSVRAGDASSGASAASAPSDPFYANPFAPGPVSAAPFGSAGILPISWMYIAMMGADGLLAATENAILAANYIAHRLSAHYPVLYSGTGGWVAHECILDLRPLKEQSGIGVEDVAKRLIDYGFHAPTMSFPVPGTLMVEPTESESKLELDRFIDAMIAIREEITAVTEGRLDREDNPLKHAPHTAQAVCGDAWTHAYTRTQAAYPLPALRDRKYWSPVGRADNAYGDRNLICSCPPLDEYL